MILIVQDDKKRNDVIEDMDIRTNVVKNYEKTNNDQDERYIKDEMNNSKTTIMKKSGRRRKSDLKDCYKRVRANKEF